MTDRALDIFLGKTAAARIAERGWNGADIELLLGASGGPKWLILGQLDRLLFSDFLAPPSNARPRQADSALSQRFFYRLTTRRENPGPK